MLIILAFADKKAYISGNNLRFFEKTLPWNFLIPQEIAMQKALLVLLNSPAIIDMPPRIS